MNFAKIERIAQYAEIRQSMQLERPSKRPITYWSRNDACIASQAAPGADGRLESRNSRINENQSESKPLASQGHVQMAQGQLLVIRQCV